MEITDSILIYVSFIAFALFFFTIIIAVWIAKVNEESFMKWESRLMSNEFVMSELMKNEEELELQEMVD